MHMCMQLYVLIYINYFLLQVYMLILAGVIGMYVHRNLHMFMSICMSLDVCVYCIRYSHNHMPTDSAVDTHIYINLSTMMHIVATNYAGALCIVPSRNTHAILI